MTVTTKLVEDIFDAIRGRFTLTEIEDLLRTDPARLIALLEQYTSEEFESQLIPQIEAVIVESGQPGIVTELLPRGAITAPYLFSISAPFTAQYIRDYTARDVAEITQNTVEAIRNTVQRNEDAGVNPRTTARQFRENIGLTVRQEQAVANYRKSLENLDRVALQRKLRDARFDRTVLSAINNDKPLKREQIDRMVARYRERYIKHRSETISRTEQLRAVSVGQRQSMLQARDAGKLSPRLRRFWVFTHDSRVRHWHSTIPMLNSDGVTIDEQYLTEPPGRVEYVTMPRDPDASAANTVQCRCRERYELI